MTTARGAEAGICFGTRGSSIAAFSRRSEAARRQGPREEECARVRKARRSFRAAPRAVNRLESPGDDRVRLHRLPLTLRSPFRLSRGSSSDAPERRLRAPRWRRCRAWRGGADRALRRERRLRRRRDADDDRRRSSSPPPSPSRRSRLAVPGQRAAEAALDAALHDLAGRRLGIPVRELLGLPRCSAATDVVDDRARPDRRGAGQGRCGRRLRGAEGEDGRRGRPRAGERRPRRDAADDPGRRQ
jgi:hypothetical protein